MNGGKKSGKLHVFGAGGSSTGTSVRSIPCSEGQQTGCRNRQNEGDRRCDRRRCPRLLNSRVQDPGYFCSRTFCTDRNRSWKLGNSNLLRSRCSVFNNRRILRYDRCNKG